MQLGLADIDTEIAAHVRQRLTGPMRDFLTPGIRWKGTFPYEFNWQFHSGATPIHRKREPSTDEQTARDLRRRREERFYRRVAIAAVVPLIPSAAVGAVLATQLGGATAIAIGAICASITWLTAAAAGGIGAASAYPRRRLAADVAIEEMKAVFPLLRLSRAERIYCDTVLLLAGIDADPATERTLRGTLHDMNALLADCRSLEVKRRALLPVMGLNSVKSLEEEYGALGIKLDTTTDTVARESIRRSLEMCATRLGNARAVDVGLQRLLAQEEALAHTLSTAQSAIARMELSPEAGSSLAAQELAAAVAHMNLQTTSVEKAVDEVVRLGATEQ